MAAAGGYWVIASGFRRRRQESENNGWSWYGYKQRLLVRKQEIEDHFKNLDLSPQEFSDKYDEYQNDYIWWVSSYDYDEFRPNLKEIKK